jgi:hypothetical protein
MHGYWIFDSGARVGIRDMRAEAVETVSASQVPSAGPGAAGLVQRAAAPDCPETPASPAIVTRAEHVARVIGPPADARPNPGTANQFHMIASDQQQDFDRIRQGLAGDGPGAAGQPVADIWDRLGHGMRV